MNRIFAIAVGVIGISLATVYLGNYLYLQRPLSAVLESDPRNEGISAKAHLSNYINPSELVFDLREVSGSNSPADVFRVVVQYA